MSSKMIYVCRECGNEYLIWQGKCSACGAWDALAEMKVDATSAATEEGRTEEIAIRDLSQIDFSQKMRLATGFSQIDEALGGGLVRGSVTLIGGEPGIGKSTLLLQMAEKIGNALYISGEESAEQVASRALRLGIDTSKIKFANSTDLRAVIGAVRKERPVLAIIDSIQTLADASLPASSGSIAQVKKVGQDCQKVAKASGVAIILVGHVTKSGQVAGPKTLEHLVDTVMYFEGDRMGDLRILRAVKNRFGRVDEIGILKMTEKGLILVDNPSEAFLSRRASGAAGAIVSCTMEGLRPIMIEIQALANRTEFGYPKRTAAGFDANRLSLIAAILESKAGLKLSQYDLYLTVIGGIKVKEVGIDAGAATAIASSISGKPVNPQSVFWGELGLTGEIREARSHAKRLREAKRMGFNFQPAKDIRELTRLTRI